MIKLCSAANCCAAHTNQDIYAAQLYANQELYHADQKSVSRTVWRIAAWSIDAWRAAAPRIAPRSIAEYSCWEYSPTKYSFAVVSSIKCRRLATSIASIAAQRDQQLSAIPRTATQLRGYMRSYMPSEV